MDYPLEEKLLETYDKVLSKEGVSGERIAKRLHVLAQIGLTEDNGSRRPGFTLLEREAKDHVVEWMKEAGLTVSEDGAGNIFGRLEGKQSGQPAVMSGSHVDTVPNGGHFDGTVGVLAALEVAQAWKETGYTPEKPFEVVCFSDEEGSRFNGGLTGSEAMVGDTDMDFMVQRVDYDGRSFEEGISDVGLTVEGYSQVGRDLGEIDTYVEVHIEQGKRLEKVGLPVGIVTGIAGPYWLTVTFKGLAGHAGNTPMNDRKDAMVAASDFILHVKDIPPRVNDTAVATVGNVTVKPNGTNVIPGEVVLQVDIRDIQYDTREEVINQIISLGESISEKSGIEVSFEHTHDVPPVPVPKERQELLKEAIEDRGITPYYLPSGAGHDAMIVGQHLPAAMIFVQSKDGISHNPLEWSELNHIVEAVHVLKRYIEKVQ
jgi:allantoate deiminase